MAKSLHFIFILLLSVLPKDIASRLPGYFTIEGDDNRIVGGDNTTIQEYPYQAYLLLLQSGEYYQCGGSIINYYYILTAAHCLIGTTNVTARLGSTYANSGGMQYSANRIIIHPLFNPITFDLDVGLVRFSRLSIDGVNTRIIKLARTGTPVPAGTILTVTGWGATSEGGNVVENLMVVDVPVVSNSECRESYNTVTRRMLCAGAPEGGKDSCGGDSGGPAVTSTGFQVGIVSNGIGCARPGIPGIYTRVSTVYYWIKMLTGIDS